MWSKEHSDAVSRANEAINLSKSELDTDVIKSCIQACRDCWKRLKDLAERRLSEPDLRGSITKESERIADTVIDISSGNDNTINELFDGNKSPELPSEQESYAKALIGALALKNGASDSNRPSEEYLKKSANLTN